MKLGKFKSNTFLKILGNRYILILILFGLWMLFLDSSGFFIHKELNKEIRELKSEKEYLKNEIDKDQKAINELQDAEKLEQFGRETYYMKKPEEEIFIIEFEEDQKK